MEPGNQVEGETARQADLPLLVRLPFEAGRSVTLLGDERQRLRPRLTVIARWRSSSVTSSM
jgi:hypothetical protein